MKSIKYSPEMAKVRREGIKTQTRRPIKEKISYCRLSGSNEPEDIMFVGENLLPIEKSQWINYCPYGQVDEIVRVEEIVKNHIEGIGQLVSLQGKDKITGLRIERVQNISEEDAKAEGVPSIASYPAGTPTILMTARKDATYKNAFSILWDSFYGETEYSWDKNPWVWIIDFEVTK